MMTPVHLTWHEPLVSREQRERIKGHRGCVIWFTGLSGCGKSTVANALDHQLQARGVHTFLLDGDNVRHGLNASPELLLAEFGSEFSQRFGLGFSPLDRQENIRRLGSVAQLFCAAGIVTLTAFVSPYRRDRERVRSLVEAAGGPGDFVEVFVDTPLEICEQRDPKGLYKLARAGQLRNFTGIDDPYEPPTHAEITLQGDRHTPQQLAAQIISYLEGAQRISPLR